MRSLLFAVACLATAAVLFWSSGGGDPGRSPRALHVVEARRGTVLSARGDVPPPPAPPSIARGRSGLVFSPPETAFSKPSDLARAKGWMKALRVHGGLPPLETPEAELERLQAVFAEATEPVARQNVIFLAALTLPADVAQPWLRTLRDGPDGDDALVAMAFDGDTDARLAFAALARHASDAAVHRLVDHPGDHEKLGEAGERDVLRSYRAIEVLDREPYFKITPVLLKARPWTERPERPDEADLLEAWLRRYPGHPGGDDVAWRLGVLAGDAGRPLDAARWFARSAALPDQDIRLGAVYDLVATCELALSPEELDVLAHDRGMDTPNRDLVQYIRLRRIAAERGLDVAVREAAGLALAEPLSPLAFAWRGEVRLPEENDARPGRIDAYSHEWRVRPEDKARLEPPAETLRFEPGLLHRQFEAWRKLAELETRASSGSRAGRAAALYAQGAAFYHDPRILFPAYGWQSENFRYVFGRAAGENGAAWQRFEEGSFGYLRAAELFRRVTREYPDWEGVDKAYFSRGLALRKALDYPPLRRWWDGDQRRRGVRAVVEAFEACVAHCPGSTLADDAARAAAYWRRTRPDAFP